MRHVLFAAALLLGACHHDRPAAVPEETTTTTTTAACEDLGIDGCQARSDCAPIMAQQHVYDHPCVLAPTQVGCMSAEAACGDALTFAVDQDNNMFWFADTCIPASFTAQPYPQGLSEPPPSC